MHGRLCRLEQCVRRAEAQRRIHESFVQNLSSNLFLCVLRAYPAGTTTSNAVRFSEFELRIESATQTSLSTYDSSPLALTLALPGIKPRLPGILESSRKRRRFCNCSVSPNSSNCSNASLKVKLER